jgi:hypothetical protein
MSAAGGNFWGFEDLKCRISFTKIHFSISNPLKNFACGGLFMFGFLYKTCKYYIVHGKRASLQVREL